MRYTNMPATLYDIKGLSHETMERLNHTGFELRLNVNDHGVNIDFVRVDSDTVASIRMHHLSAQANTGDRVEWRYSYATYSPTTMHDIADGECDTYDEAFDLIIAEIVAYERGRMATV